MKPRYLSFLFSGFSSGLLLVLSLPKPDLYPLAWVALVPLLLAIGQARTWRVSAITSYLAGLFFFAGTFYWITETMLIYGGLSLPSAIGVGLLFCITYALHFVLFATPVWLAIRRWGPKGVFSAAPVWVTVELLRAHWFSGFPWMLSGYALTPFPGLLQIVTFTGIYGLSCVATFINSAIVYGIFTKSRGWIIATLLVTLGLSLLPIIPSPPPPSGDALHARLVQTNIPLDYPWDNEVESRQLMDDLQKLSTSQPDAFKLIVWPETPAPFYLKEDPEFRSQMQAIARKSNADVLVGYIDKIDEGPTNSVGLVNPQGDVISRYDKQHLVPFGEYIPFKNLLFFADSLTRQVGDFQPGRELTLSPIDSHRFSTAICYESIFPGLVRQFVLRGSELLVVVTNDGWFGVSSAPYQHLRMGVVRAVENRRYELRNANTGISAIIDPYGRIESSTPIGQRMVLDGTVFYRSDLTFYTRHGDLFAYLNTVVAVIVLLAAVSDRRRVKRKE
jgi:apolipoprotein N-acyltransferase